VRAHVVLPEEMIEEIDRIAGKRGRSKFIEEAVREKLALAKQQDAMRKYAGALKDYDFPAWSTPEKVSEWIHEQRSWESDRLDEKIARWGKKLSGDAAE